jgi:hypothetical protein
MSQGCKPFLKKAQGYCRRAHSAAVVELVDTQDSESCGGNPVGVQISPAAH